MAKHVGKTFREVVIDSALKYQVNRILRAEAADDPEALDAKQRIRTMAKGKKAYLYASEIRGYLEEKTQVGTEKWVFPVAGDLFLDALEGNLEQVGPNFLRDHYSCMMGCYRQGDSNTKPIEGPLYCVELALENMLVLFKARSDARQAPEGGIRLSFVDPDASSYRRRIAAVLGLAHGWLGEAIELAIHADRGSIPTAFLDFVGMHRQELDKAIVQWDRYHSREDLAECTYEDYLAGALEVADRVDFPPLVAAVKERLAALHESEEGAQEITNELERSIHPFYEAADILLEEGNRARDSYLQDLCLRRYKRAVNLFSRIHDRTSMAKVLVEMARAYVQRGDDLLAAKEALYEGVRLVMAHMKGLPQGRLPTPSDTQVVAFLEKKGYAIEARAYADAMAQEEEARDPYEVSS